MFRADFDLAASARAEMIRNGFDPNFAPGSDEQIGALRKAPPPVPAAGVRDLRNLLWSSIDNDTSKDLDQIEVAERTAGGIRVLIGIADVDNDVSAGSPIDRHAAEETVTVYTAVRNFPMLPEALSTDLTSLNESADRAAIVIEMLVEPEGSIASSEIYRAVVRNTAQLTYNAVGDWLEGRSGPGPKVAASAELQAQLKLQDEAATALRAQRHRLGALNFDRVEPVATVTDGHVSTIGAARKTRANDLIEDFMVAANEVMAKTLKDVGASSMRRIVRSPERWPRIVELAAQHGTQLPGSPDPAALNAFLEKQRAGDPVHYADLSLAVVKLMGPGEYVMTRANETGEGHFGLAAHDYTHSTAPNRRYADLVTQRLIKAVLAKGLAPYSDAELESIARNCTLKEDAARKVERVMGKRVAAVAMRDRIGELFGAVVTGVTPKGTFVRVLNPPVEGLLARGQSGLDVGDRIQVTLIATDPESGYLDFAR
ncbi:MAG TPA: RNB domain-containing ribonuclease [Bryobacteraceae bacterium]|nr:RNB domain-containing ribonuclease [Bryobacteraceae bacterium]